MEDVGRVQVQAWAREGLCQVLGRVARVVDWIVGVFYVCPFCPVRACCSTLRSRWGRGGGHMRVVVNSHWGSWSGLHATVGLTSVWWNHGATNT